MGAVLENRDVVAIMGKGGKIRAPSVSFEGGIGRIAQVPNWENSILMQDKKWP